MVMLIVRPLDREAVFVLVGYKCWSQTSTESHLDPVLCITLNNVCNSLYLVELL